MTPEEMQKNSEVKVKQVMDLLKTLHLRVEARQRISQQGFIEMAVFWNDDENYPVAEGPIPQSTIDAEKASDVAEVETETAEVAE